MGELPKYLVHRAAEVDWGDGSAPEAISPAAGAIGLPQNTPLNIVHAYAQPGAYDVQVCVVDDDAGQGCTTDAVVVTDLPDPTVTATPDPTITATPVPTTITTVTSTSNSQGVVLAQVAEAEPAVVATAVASPAQQVAGVTELAYTGPKQRTHLITIGLLAMAFGFTALGGQRRRGRRYAR